MQLENLPKAVINTLYDTKTPKHNEVLTFFTNNIIQIHNTSENTDAIESTLKNLITNQLTENTIKQVHTTLKQKSTRNHIMYPVGNYKKLDPYRKSHTKVEFIPQEMKALLTQSRNTVIDNYMFFFDFLRIHPFFDGNGRTARTITAIEMLKHNIIPFSFVMPQDAMVFKLNYIAYLKSDFDIENEADAILALEKTRPLTEKIMLGWFN